MRRVILSPVEVRIAKWVGEMRVKGNRSIPDPVQGDHDDRNSLHTKGVLGEFAFCRAMNIWPPLDVTRGQTKRPRHDCVYQGLTFDVKATIPNARFFLVPLNKQYDPSDVYVHVLQHSESEYEILGAIEGRKVFDREPEYFDPKDKEPRFIVRREELVYVWPEEDAEDA